MLVDRVCRALRDALRAAACGSGLPSPIEFLESLADILFIPLPAGRVRGASFLLEGRPVAVVDANLSGLRRQAVAAHEAGHLTLHPWANRVFMQASTLALPGRYETEADVFALAYLLRWDQGLAEQFGWDLARLAGACGLPRAVPYIAGIFKAVFARK